MTELEETILYKLVFPTKPVKPRVITYPRSQQLISERVRANPKILVA